MENINFDRCLRRDGGELKVGNQFTLNDRSGLRNSCDTRRKNITISRALAKSLEKIAENKKNAGGNILINKLEGTTTISRRNIDNMNNLPDESDQFGGGRRRRKMTGHTKHFTSCLCKVDSHQKFHSKKKTRKRRRKSTSARSKTHVKKSKKKKHHGRRPRRKTKSSKKKVHKRKDNFRKHNIFSKIR